MFHRVVLAVDLTDSGSWQRALPVALDLLHQSAGTLHVVTVAPEVSPLIAGYFPAAAGREIVTHAAADLHRFVSEHIPSDVRVQEIVAQGAIHQEILAAAEQVDADLIVMASRRSGVRTYLLGANAAHVVRHSPCSVLVVRGSD